MSGDLPYLDASDVAHLGPSGAFAALEQALLNRLDTDADPARSIVDVPGGQLLVMPSAAAGRAVVKLVTVGGEPRIQGVCVVFDPETLAPAALVDGIALTNLRTAAVSALAVDRLATPEARRLLVFGRGPQAEAHVEAIRRIRPIDRVDQVGRDRDGIDVDALVRAADVICCCTTAREPLFDGDLVAAHAAVVAIGSHEADARETDDALVGRSTVVVESLSSAPLEAGDIVMAIAAGVLDASRLVSLGAVVRAEVTPAPDRPRLCKTTGMAWEDAVVAAALVSPRS